MPIAQLLTDAHLALAHAEADLVEGAVALKGIVRRFIEHHEGGEPALVAPASEPSPAPSTPAAAAPAPAPAEGAGSEPPAGKVSAAAAAAAALAATTA